VTGLTPIAAINAYHISGGLLAAWAVLVTVVGITRPSFPGSTGQARVTGAISITLVVATIGLAIYEGTREEEEGGGEAAAEPAPASEPAPAGGGAALKLAADPGGQLSFDKSSLTADAGKVTIAMKNDSDIPHDVSIEGKGVDEEGKDVTGGGTSTVTATLEPGKYTFYCSVPGHRQAGMEGTLTVR
jgi:plastocyanin